MKNTYSNNKSIWKNKGVRTWESEVIKERCKILDIEYEDYKNEEMKEMSKGTQNQEDKEKKKVKRKATPEEDEMGTVAAVNGMPVYTVKQAAIKAKTSITTVGAYISSGRLPATKVARTFLITEKDLDKFCQDIAMSKTHITTEHIGTFNGTRYYKVSDLERDYNIGVGKIKELEQNKIIKTDKMCGVHVIAADEAKKVILFFKNEENESGGIEE